MDVGSGIRCSCAYFDGAVRGRRWLLRLLGCRGKRELETTLDLRQPDDLEILAVWNDALHN